MKRSNPLASITNQISLLLLLCLTLLLQACGGGGGPAATYKVDGTVAGLGDTPLILQNNGGGTASQNITTIVINCGVVATGYYNTGSANVKTDNTNNTTRSL